MIVEVETFEGRANLFAPHAVFVRLGLRLKPRVEVGGNFGDVEHSDGTRQQMIDRALQVNAGDGIGKGTGGDLGEGMDSGIGAARRGDGNAGAFDFGDDALDSFLDGGDAGLDLPTVEVGAIVTKHEANAAMVNAIHRQLVTFSSRV